MCAFVDYIFLNTSDSVEDDSSGAAFHVVYGSLSQGRSYEEWDRVLGDCVEDVWGRHG